MTLKYPPRQFIKNKIRHFEMHPGELLFESNNQERGWDGTTFNQEMALPGVYIYRLDFVGFERDGSTFEGKKYGTVTLIR